MYIKQEPFGFVVEIDNLGRAPIKLTFEEVYSRNLTSKKYYCCVDIGLYQRNYNRLEFKSLGSFEFKDWFNFNLDLKKRTKLKRLVGSSVYDDLVRKVNLLVQGRLVLASDNRSEVV